MGKHCEAPWSQVQTLSECIITLLEIRKHSDTQNLFKTSPYFPNNIKYTGLDYFHWEHYYKWSNIPGLLTYSVLWMSLLHNSKTFIKSSDHYLLMFCLFVGKYFISSQELGDLLRYIEKKIYNTIQKYRQPDSQSKGWSPDDSLTLFYQYVATILMIYCPLQIHEIICWKTSFSHKWKICTRIYDPNFSSSKLIRKWDLILIEHQYYNH